MPERPMSSELVRYFIERTDAKLEELESHIDKRFEQHEGHLDSSIQELRLVLSEIKHEQDNQKVFKAKLLGASIAVSTIVSIAGWAIALVFGVH